MRAIWYSAEKGDECFVAQVVEWSPRARCDMDKRSAAASREPGGSSQSSQREWSRWDSSDMDGQTREGETSGKKANQAVRDGQAKRGTRRELGSSSQWPGIMAHGETREEAARQIQIALEGALEVAAERGIKPPAPALAQI